MNQDVIDYLNKIDINNYDVSIKTSYLCEVPELPYDMQEAIPYKVISISNPRLLNITINAKNDNMVTIRSLASGVLTTRITPEISKIISKLLGNFKIEFK